MRSKPYTKDELLIFAGRMATAVQALLNSNLFNASDNATSAHIALTNYNAAIMFNMNSDQQDKVD